MELVSIRTKMGFEIRCYRAGDVFAYFHDGALLHVTVEDVTCDKLASDAHFFTAWREASGFVPFTVLRRFKGKLRPHGVLFTRGFQNVRVKTWPRGRAWCMPLV